MILGVFMTDSFLENVTFNGWNVMALCWVVLLAGCSGGVLGTQANAPSLSEVEYPDGASASGIDEPISILNTTVTRSKGTDYTVTSNQTFVYANGSRQKTVIEKKASLSSKSARYDVVLDPNGQERTVIERFISGGDSKFTAYIKESHENGETQFDKEGPFGGRYSESAHHLLTEPNPVDFGLYYKFLEFRNLTATGTTMVDGQPAIIYELANPGSPDEPGTETVRVTIGTNGTLYELRVTSQLKNREGGLATRYLRVSFDPGEVNIEEPEWIGKAK